jgi:hypothetical protein
MLAVSPLKEKGGSGGGEAIRWGKPGGDSAVMAASWHGGSPVMVQRRERGMGSPS